MPAINVPCRYSIDELKNRLEKSQTSAKEGKYKTQSEIKKKACQIHKQI
jgi:hypothetical protein